MRILRVLCLLAFFSVAVMPAPGVAADPAVVGIPNFHRVDGRLFRGGQPAPGSWRALAMLGVKTVIDLRRDGEHSTASERCAVEAAGMRYVSFPMNGFETPTAAEMADVLALVGTGDTLFIHCRLGMDRTGTVVAAYRIAHEGWTNQRALDEAEGLGLHWYEHGMKRLIRDYHATDHAAVGIAPASGSTSGRASNSTDRASS